MWWVRAAKTYGVIGAATGLYTIPSNYIHETNNSYWGNPPFPQAVLARTMNGTQGIFFGMFEALVWPIMAMEATRVCLSDK